MIVMYHKKEQTCFNAVTMQDWKDMEEKNIELKIYEDVKVETKRGCVVNHEL